MRTQLKSKQFNIVRLNIIVASAIVLFSKMYILLIFIFSASKTFLHFFLLRIFDQYVAISVLFLFLFIVKCCLWVSLLYVFLGGNFFQTVDQPLWSICWCMGERFFLNNSSNQYIYSGDVTLLSLACKLLMMFVSPCHLKYLNLFIASTFAQISRCKHKDAWRLALCFAAVARCIDVRWMTTNQMARRILNTVRLRELAMRPSDS